MTTKNNTKLSDFFDTFEGQNETWKILKEHKKPKEEIPQNISINPSGIFKNDPWKPYHPSQENWYYLHPEKYWKY